MQLWFKIPSHCIHLPFCEMLTPSPRHAEKYRKSNVRNWKQNKKTQPFVPEAHSWEASSCKSFNLVVPQWCGPGKTRPTAAWNPDHSPAEFLRETWPLLLSSKVFTRQKKEEGKMVQCFFCFVLIVYTSHLLARGSMLYKQHQCLQKCASISGVSFVFFYIKLVDDS